MIQKQLINQKNRILEKVVYPIEADPHQYLASRSILQLGNYLNGYRYVIQQACMKVESKIYLETDPLDLFSKWIGSRYGYLETHEYIGIILFDSKDEFEGFKNYFALLRQFEKETPKSEMPILQYSMLKIKEQTSKDNLSYESMLRVQPTYFDFYEMLEQIQYKHGFYIRAYGLNHLYSFLQGYFKAKEDIDIALSNEEKQFLGFQKWIREKYEISEAKNWAEIINFYSFNDKHALDQFYEKLTKFRLE